MSTSLLQLLPPSGIIAGTFCADKPANLRPPKRPVTGRVHHALLLPRATPRIAPTPLLAPHLPASTRDGQSRRKPGQARSLPSAPLRATARATERTQRSTGAACSREHPPDAKQTH